MSKNQHPDLKNGVIVSVCIITFNQDKYIAQTLESVFSQEVNFNYEVIIYDDCSTDSTPSIINKFIKEFPNQVTYLRSEENQFSKGIKHTRLRIKSVKGNILPIATVTIIG